MKETLKQKLRNLFIENPNALFSFEEIRTRLKVTKKQKGVLNVYLSNLKNPEYTDKPLDIIQIEGSDRVKRWGFRDAITKN